MKRIKILLFRITENVEYEINCTSNKLHSIHSVSSSKIALQNNRASMEIF